jgi:DNA-binding MarR family transcriptional regulator
MAKRSLAPPDFELTEFLPYMLNQAAEAASAGFQPEYKNEYGMLRTEWRVMVHLGRFGQMTATDLGARAGIHKTKISRAVAALERKRFLIRTTSESDRRVEVLSLTPTGLGAYRKLSQTAAKYDRALSARFTPEEERILRKCLKALVR